VTAVPTMWNNLPADVLVAKVCFSYKTKDTQVFTVAFAQKYSNLKVANTSVP